MPLILVDRREGESIVELLRDMGAEVKVVQLEIGDFLLSHRACAERKVGGDFFRSLKDGRIFEQAKQLSAYELPILIVEGEVPPLKPKLLYGLLSSLTCEYNLRIFHTPDEIGTATLLFKLARKEQARGGMKLRQKKRRKEIKEVQLQLVSALPGIGAKLAHELLKHFKAPISVFKASVGELSKVKLIGRKKAEKIREVLTSPYA